MKKNTLEKLAFARNVWLVFISAIMVYKLIEYLSSPLFAGLISNHGLFGAILLVALIFIFVYAVFVAPALMIHVFLWDARKFGRHAHNPP